MALCTSKYRFITIFFLNRSCFATEMPRLLFRLLLLLSLYDDDVATLFVRLIVLTPLLFAFFVFYHLSTVESSKCFCATGTSIFVLGIILVLLGAFIPRTVDHLLETNIRDALVLTPDSQTSNSDQYKTFIDNGDADSVPVYVKVTFFNVTNPEEILEGHAAAVTEQGPYVYRKVTKRENVTFSTDYFGATTISYLTRHIYHFDRDQTPAHLSESDTCTTVNVQYWALKAFNFTNPSYFSTDLERLVMNRPVKDLLFGFSVFPDHPESKERFPGFIGANDTIDGTFDTIHTGESDLAQIRQYLKVNGHATVGKPGLLDIWTGIWGSDYANNIYGTDATQFHPNVRKGEILNSYVSEVRRVVPFDYKGEYKVHKINLYNFGLTGLSMLNKTSYAPNADFSMDGPSGTFNAKPSSGIELYYSKPHFLDVVPSQDEFVQNMKPNREIHDIRIGVEPRTGAVMDANKALQGNFRVGPVQVDATVTFFPNMKDFYFPAGWLTEAGTITPSKAKTFRSKVVAATDASYYVFWIGFTLGPALILIGAIFFFKYTSPSAVYEQSSFHDVLIPARPGDLPINRAGGVHGYTAL